jgi:hypothetical protein
MAFMKRQSELIAISQRVTEKMENNPVFPNPPAALAELKKVLPEFLVALGNARGRDKEMVSLKNDKKTILLSLLVELAEYVTATCKGEKTPMLSSGFDVIENNGTTTSPSIETLDVELGQPGEATTRIRKVTGALAYIHQYATELPGVNTVWVGEGSSHREHTFTGLASDKRYWFRVIVIGSARQKAYSPIVSRAIQ